MFFTTYSLHFVDKVLVGWLVLYGISPLVGYLMLSLSLSLSLYIYIYIYIYTHTHTLRKTKLGHIRIIIYFHPAMGFDMNQ